MEDFHSERPGLERTQGGRLTNESINFNIPSNQNAVDHAAEVHGTDSWQYKTMHVLHSHKVQKLLILLLALDVLILFAEWFLLATYPHCSIIERDAISCCPATGDDSHLRFLAEEEHHDVCTMSGLHAVEFASGCDEHKWSTIHTVEKVLFSFTVVILSLFWIELNVAMVCLKPNIFFRQFFYLLDYVVISISLILECTFFSLSDDIYQSFVGLLVITRIWRFIRIGHGIGEIVNEMAHKEFEGLLVYTEVLEDLLKENDIVAPEGPQSHRSSDHCSLLEVIERARREKKRQNYRTKLSSESDKLAEETAKETKKY